MTDSDIVVNIREIQHYFYCPHRWGLIHIGSDWSENFFINKAQIIHDNVNGKTSSLLRAIVGHSTSHWSHSARSAWIEIHMTCRRLYLYNVALRTECVD